MQYEVKSDRAQTVTGLGVFAEGETRTFTVSDAERFQGVTGIQLLPGNVPEGIDITIQVGVAEEVVDG